MGLGRSIPIRCEATEMKERRKKKESIIDVCIQLTFYVFYR